MVEWRKRETGEKVLYTVTCQTVGLAIGPLSETSSSVQDALSKACQMYEDGLANVSINDEAGHQIDGDELVACITGRRNLTKDLRAV